jgi:hypothetical protein
MRPEMQSRSIYNKENIERFDGNMYRNVPSELSKIIST